MNEWMTPGASEEKDRRILELEAQNRGLSLARDQLVRERDIQARRADNAVEANARHLETEAQLRRDLDKADDRARVHFADRLERQTRALNDLQAAHKVVVEQLKNHRSGAELAHIRSRLAAKNRVVSEALQAVDKAVNDTRMWQKQALDARTKNNAECLDELHVQQRQNTAHQENVKQLKEQLAQIKESTWWMEPGAKIEYRMSVNTIWRPGTMVGFFGDNGCVVRDATTQTQVTLPISVRRATAYVKYDINIKNAGGDLRFSGTANEEQVNKAIDILKGEE